ncbi:MAG: hypothetical protein U0529_01975 [Thermoanaerobaculia bacterium]
MSSALFLVLFAAVLLCLSDFRKGIIVIAAVGLLQDLVRKLAPGQPTYLMGLVFIAFAATFAGALARENPFWWRRRDWESLRTPLGLFALAFGVQALVSYVRIGSLVLIGVGLAAYAGPVVALVLGSWAGARHGVVQRFLVAYLVFVALMASGIVLYQAGYRWPSLMSIGPGLTVYDWRLGAVYLPPGFFRAPEVASWHCATAACVAVTLAAARKATSARWAALGGLAVLFSWCVIVAGRRKGLGEIVIFLALFAYLQVWYRGRLGRLGPAVLVTILIGAFAFQRYGLQEKAAAQIGSMRERSDTAGGAAGRFLGGATSLPQVVEAAGFFGTGLGTGTQGAQHFRTEGEKWNLISESGLARVVAELGVPGSVTALFLLIRFGSNLRERARMLRRATEADPAILLGLTALVFSNAVVFISAHQIFGDPFVYIFLGLATGFVVAGLDEEGTASWRDRRRAAVMPVAA